MKVIRVTHAQYGLGNGKIYTDTNGYNIKVEFDCGSTTTFDYNYTFEKGILKLADPNDKLPFPIVMLHQTTPKASSTPNLSNILKRYIADFNQKKHLSFVVKESIPIVWFGDIDAYFNSKLKVVTIGLNPSEQEFMYKDNFNNMISLPKNGKRFDIIDFTKLSVDEQIEKLKATLNNYFKKRPYKWFDKYNKLLTVKNCSYYPGIKNTAIHIDLFSAIATTPTWGKLNNKQKFQIENKKLFLDLLEILNPDFALCSVNNDTFLQVFSNYNKINQQKFAGNNYIRVYKKNGADRIILNGTNMQGTPWGGIQEGFSKIIINTPNADCGNCKHYLSNNCGGIRLCTYYKG